MMKQSPEAIAAAKFQKKWLSKIKNIAIAVYYLVIPFLQSPDWCTNAWRDYAYANDIKLYKTDLRYHCQWVSFGINPPKKYEGYPSPTPLNIMFSAFPDIAPLYTGTIDILCLLTLCYFRCYKQKWRRSSIKDIRRT